MLAEIRQLISSSRNLSGSHAEIAAQLNAKVLEVSDGVTHSVASIARTLGPQSARQILGKLQQAANRDPLVEAWYDTIVSKGVSFADADTRAMLDALVGSGALSNIEAESLKQIGVRRLSEVERLLGEGVSVTADDVRAALEAKPDRTRLVISVVKDEDIHVTIVEQPMLGDTPFERARVVTWRRGDPIPENHRTLIDAIVEGVS